MGRIVESVEPVLTVKSVYRSVDWYCNFLGFTADFLNEESGEENSLNYTVLRNGNAGIHLGLERDMGVLAGNGGCNFVTRQFDEMHNRAVNANAKFHVDLGEIPSGARSFGIRDPDGNILTFVEAR